MLYPRQPYSDQERLIKLDQARQREVEGQFNDYREAMVKIIRETGNVAKVTEVTGVSRSRFYRFCEEYPDFAAEIAEARAEAFEHLEDIARCRAVHGHVKTRTKRIKIEDAWGCEVWVEHEQIEEHTYDNNLLVKLLEANMPNKWRQRSSVEIDPGEKAQTLAGLLLSAATQDPDEDTPTMGTA